MIKNWLCLLPLACICCSVQAVPLTWSQTAKLLPDNVEPADQFGTSIAIDGGVTVVGSMHADYGAYSFDTQTGELLASMLPNTDPGSIAPRSVAVHGQTAIVGSYADGVANNRPGAAYLFDATTGDQLAKLIASDASSGDRFGASVAIGDGIAVVGAPYNGSGAAYVFDVHSGQELAKLTSPGSQEVEGFATSLAISGDKLVVGSIAEDQNRGAAFLYDLPTGTPLAKLQPDEPFAGHRYGWAVDIEGDTIVVGGNSGDSAAYLFDGATGQQTHRIAPDEYQRLSFYGLSVAVNETYAAVGHLSNSGDAFRAGGAYVFDVESGEIVTHVAPNDVHTFQEFGYSLAFDANLLAIGAQSDSTAASFGGAAYLFELVPEPSAAWLAIALGGCCGCRWRP